MGCHCVAGHFPFGLVEEGNERSEATSAVRISRTSSEIKQLADRNADHKAIHGLADRWIGIDDTLRLIFRPSLCAIIAPSPPRS